MGHAPSMPSKLLARRGRVETFVLTPAVAGMKKTRLARHAVGIESGPLKAPRLLLRDPAPGRCLAQNPLDVLRVSLDDRHSDDTRNVVRVI
jgi:hypothetical protein